MQERTVSQPTRITFACLRCLERIIRAAGAYSSALEARFSVICCTCSGSRDGTAGTSASPTRTAEQQCSRAGSDDSEQLRVSLEELLRPSPQRSGRPLDQRPSVFIGVCTSAVTVHLGSKVKPPSDVNEQSDYVSHARLGLSFNGNLWFCWQLQNRCLLALTQSC